MTQISNIYLGAIGGLGDIFYTYKYNPIWQKLNSYKYEYPDIKTKAIIVSYNPNAYKVFELNPFIDEIVNETPKREMRDLKWKPKQVIAQYSDNYLPAEQLKLKTPKETEQHIYFKSKEKELIHSLGEYTVIHPFASSRERKVLDKNKWIKIIDLLADKGERVVLLGGSMVKTFGKEKYPLKETFNYQRDNLINCVDSTDIRTAVGLSIRAKRFIGCWSCFAVISWMSSVPSDVIINKKFINGCTKIHNNKYFMHNKEDKIITTNNIQQYIDSLR